MSKSVRADEVIQAVSAIGGGQADGRRYAAAIMQAEEADLLAYIGDHIAELESMAVSAKLESITDLLGYTVREIERCRNRKQPAAQ